MLVYGTGQRIIWFLLSLNIFYQHQKKVYAQEINSNRKIANACRTSAECPTNAFCEHNRLPSEFGQCICQEGYFIREENKIKRCHKVATQIGDQCSFEEECQIAFGADSQCRDGACQCKPLTHFSVKDGSCFKSALIGEYCRVSSNCIGDGVVCRSGKCDCAYTHHPNRNRTHCLKTIQLGEPCTQHEECVSNYSMCHNDCICKAGYTLNTNKTACLKIATKLYDFCEDSCQCTVTIGCSKCGDNSTCVCANGFHDVDYQCWQSVQLGFACEKSQNCVVEHSHCVNGRCVCKEGFRRSQMQCSSKTQSISSQFLLICALVLISVCKIF